MFLLLVSMFPLFSAPLSLFFAFLLLYSTLECVYSDFVVWFSLCWFTCNLVCVSVLLDLYGVLLPSLPDEECMKDEKFLLEKF